MIAVSCKLNHLEVKDLRSDAKNVVSTWFFFLKECFLEWAAALIKTHLRYVSLTWSRWEGNGNILKKVKLIADRIK